MTQMGCRGENLRIFLLPKRRRYWNGIIINALNVGEAEKTE